MCINKNFNLYVLKLVNQKFYVGKTCQSVYNRFIQHKNGDGAIWTKIYKPLEILEQFKTNNKFDEDLYTKKYMDKYGIENVRGGSYTKKNLEDWEIKALNKELKSSNNLCFKCGKRGHFVNQCKN
jgi:hypothetical protein